MWTRADLKQEAKHHLGGRYWSAFAVALIMALIGGGRIGTFNYSVNGNDWNRMRENWQNWGTPGQWQSRIPDFFNNLNGPMIVVAIVAAFFAISFGILFAIFVSSVIEAGGMRWFSRSREMANPPSIGFMFSLFKGGNYLPTVAAQFWRNLFLFLWSLVPIGFGIIGGIALFVPFAVSTRTGSGATANGWQNTVGPILVIVYVTIIMLLSIIVINRTYAYRMVPWILGDNPTIGRKRALGLSIEMTRGHRFAMFVLDLSFIGWFLLGVLACGVGTLFVLPYYDATQAELYDRLRSLSVEKGISRMEDYGFVRTDSTGGQ